ncbi:unnamed protein product [Penicillium palitans]
MSLGQANHFRLVASVRSNYAIKRYIDETKRLYSVLESRLKESTYLAGSKYTIADITNYTWVRRGPQLLEIDLSEFPALKNWVDEIDKRPAVQKGTLTAQMSNGMRYSETPALGLMEWLIPISIKRLGCIVLHS